MMVSVEISYYPLTEDFNGPITAFLQQLTSAMCTLMERYPSVFNIKISNSCMV